MSNTDIEMADDANGTIDCERHPPDSPVQGIVVPLNQWLSHFDLAASEPNT